jgi:hypothetical protein
MDDLLRYAKETGLGLARGASQGMTFNLGEEGLGWLAGKLPVGTVGLNDTPSDLASRYASIFRGGAGGLPTDSVTSTTGDYATERDRYRALNRATQEESPYASFAGDVLGGLASPNKAGQAKKVAGWLKSAGQAASQGALSAFGASEASDEPGQLADTVGGGAMGAVGDALGRGVGKALPWAAAKVRDSLNNFAKMRAVNAAGMGGNELKHLLREKGEDGVLEMGRHLLEEPGVIRFGRKADDVVEGVQNARKRWGWSGEMGKYLDEADAAGVKFRYKPLVDKVRSEIVKEEKGNPFIAGEVGAIGSLMNELAQRTGRMKKWTTFRGANELRSSQANGINWGNHWNNSSPSQYLDQFDKKLAGIFTGEVDRQLGEALGDKARQGFQNAKARTGTMVAAENFAKNLQAKQQGNYGLSLKDLVAASAAGGVGGAAEGGLGGAVGTLAGAVGMKVARERGPSALARGAYEVANSEPIFRILEQNPEALGKWGAQLSRAAAQSREALSLTHYLLSQRDPEYARRIEEISRQDNGQ